MTILNQSTFCSEFSSTLLVPYAVLGTPTEGYQKSGMVWFAILVPFTTSDNGNGHNCVPYCTEPYRSVETSHYTYFALSFCGSSWHNSDQFWQKAAGINRELELEAHDLEEAAKEAEQVLQRFNPSQVLLNTFSYSWFALMNASLFYVLIITFLTVLPLKYFGHFGHF